MRTAAILPPRFRQYSHACPQTKRGKRVNPEPAHSYHQAVEHVDLITIEMFSHSSAREMREAELLMSVIRVAMEDLGRLKWPTIDHGRAEGVSAAEFLGSPDLALYCEPIGLDAAWVLATIKRWARFEGLRVPWGIGLVPAAVRAEDARRYNAYHAERRAAHPEWANVYKENRRKRRAAIG